MRNIRRNNFVCIKCHDKSYMCVNILTSREYMHVVKWLSAANISHIRCWHARRVCLALLRERRHECVPKQNVRIRQGLVTLNTRREFPPKSLSRATRREKCPIVPDVAWMRRNMTRYTRSCLGCAARSMINHSFERSDSTVPSRGWLAPTDMSLHRVGNQRNCLRAMSWE